MSELTLQQVFGAGASQTATGLTISKTDLVSMGLTASADNKAESLLVAILLLAKQQLTNDNLQVNADQSISIEESQFPALTIRNNQTYRQTTLSVNLQKLDISNVINPDDY